jgi:Phosphoesterase family
MHGRRIRHRTGRLGRLASSCLIAAGLTLVGVGAGQSAQAQPAKAPSLSHVFVIVEENNGYHDVIGNPAAPNLTHLAKTFGVATDYFGVSPCCSETNYVGLLGGNTFNVPSDDAYWKNTVHAPSLISQLDKARISWKAYLQALPYPGYEGICYPAKCNGAPDSDPLFVSKHDGIQNYTTSQNPADWSRQVPIGTLAADLHQPRPARIQGRKPGQPLLAAEQYPAQLRPRLPAVHLRHQAREAADPDVRRHRHQGHRHHPAARAELAHPHPGRSQGTDLRDQGHPERGRLDRAENAVARHLGQQCRRHRGFLVHRHLGRRRLPPRRGEEQPGRDPYLRRALQRQQMDGGPDTEHRPELQLVLRRSRQPGQSLGRGSG